MATEKSYRESIGIRLKAFREERNLTAYRVALKGGISITQVKMIEEGATSYTIDTFLKYIRGCDLYMFLGEKASEADSPIDVDDMIRSMSENNPK